MLVVADQLADLSHAKHQSSFVIYDKIHYIIHNILLSNNDKIVH